MQVYRIRYAHETLELRAESEADAWVRATVARPDGLPVSVVAVRAAVTRIPLPLGDER